jgi:predicted enzyme related to lactoylglutathione lyase
MSATNELQGLCNINYWAKDVKAARKWYAELLGIDPYFERPDTENPAYVEFRIGDYKHELGIIDSQYAPEGSAKEAGGAVAYWHVRDVEGMLKKLVDMGAREFAPVTHHGSGFTTASVIDPFGNVLGIMYNPHYLEILASGK